MSGTEIMDALICDMLEVKGQSPAKAVQELGQYEYIVTLDMGCGNTSATVQKIQNGKGNNVIELSRWMYKYQDLDDYKKHTWSEATKSLYIPTMFGYVKGSPTIGPYARNSGKASDNFKCIPTDENLKAFKQLGKDKTPLREIWSKYFGLALEQVLEYARTAFSYTDISKGNTIFVVAHPSSALWANAQIAGNYRKLIADGLQSATGMGVNVRQILTFSEAKAAMQYVRNKDIKLNWLQGVIIFDLGASTIDANYRVYGGKQLEFSMAMAGKDVDGLLGHYVLERLVGPLQGLENNQLPDEAYFADPKRKDSLGMNSKSDFTYFIRIFKENICYYACSSETDNEPEFRGLRVSGDDLGDILSSRPFSFSGDASLVRYMDENINGAILNGQTISGVTWYDYFTYFVRFVLDAIQRDKTVKVGTIIVTGGTANLFGIEDCIKRACGRVFKQTPNIAVYNNSSDYNRAIPVGSAEYVLKVLRSIPQLETFPADLQAAIWSDIENKKTQVADKIYSAISGICGAALVDTFKVWAAGCLDAQKPLDQTHLSKSGLEALLKAEIESRVSRTDMTNTIQEITALCKAGNKFKNASEKIRNLINALCDGTEYKEEISTEVNIKISKETIIEIAGFGTEKAETFNFVNVIAWFFNIGLGGKQYYYETHPNEIIPSAVRIKMADAATGKRKKNILDSIEKNVKKEAAANFEELCKNGDALTDTVNEVIKNLKTTIEQAMFLG